MRFAVMEVGPGGLVEGFLRRPAGVGNQSGNGGGEHHAPHPVPLGSLQNIERALNRRKHKLFVGVLGVLQRARRRHVEYSLAPLHGLAHSLEIQHVGLVHHHLALVGKEVRGVGARENGGVDGGVAGLQQGPHQP